MASLNTLSRAVLAVDTLSRLDSGWHDNKDGMNLKQVRTIKYCLIKFNMTK
jgi:hypothetical protein